MHHFRRQPAERPTFPFGIRVEDRVPTQDIAGERLLMAAGALPCPCKVRHLYVSLFKVILFHVKFRCEKSIIDVPYSATVLFRSDPVFLC
jgi:hypothetical protein